MPDSYEILEDVHIQEAVVNQSLTTGTAFTSSYYAIQDYDRIVALASMEAMTAASTCILTLLKATDSSGTGSTSAGTATFTAAAGALSGCVAVEKRSSELASTYTHVAVKVQTDETKYGGAVLLRGKAKIKPVSQTITTG